MKEPELRDLAFAAGKGDRDAATSFIRATQREVQRFMVSMLGLRDIEDLVQETYARTLGALPGFAGRSSVRTWLFAIARRVAADHLRQMYRRPPVAEVSDWVTADEATDLHGRSRFDEHYALLDLLARLPADQREAFVATQVLDLTYAEAAQWCGVPVGTIRSRVARAREHMIVEGKLDCTAC